MLSLAAALALAVPAAAPQGQGPALVAELRDPSGLPVAGAAAELLLEPRSALPALHAVPAGLAPLAGMQPAAEWLRGLSDRGGRLRLRPAAGELDGRRGAGLATTAAGLGVLVPWLWPGDARRLVMAPMAMVAAADGQPFTAHLRADLGDGTAVRLPPQHGREVRLPAGSYEAWLATAQGYCWQRFELRPNQRATFAVPADAQRLQAAAPRLWPAGWPELDLLAGGAAVTLRGAALAAPLCAAPDGRWCGPQVLPGPPQPQPRAWPEPGPPPAMVEVAVAAPPPGAAAVLLRRSDGLGWLPVHLAAAAPTLRLPKEVPGDAWLLLLAPDHAPRAVPWSAHPPAAELAFARGVPLVVEARDEAGLPVADLLVDYAPEGMAPALVAARTDARGLARLGPVLAPGRLRTSDPRHENSELPLRHVPLDGARLVVRAGLPLSGHARWPDGSPAAGVVVTLRDPAGALRPAARSAVADAAGGFAFAGLPEGGEYVLWATAPRDGRTYSARLPRARAGDDSTLLVLRDEDPPPLGPRR